MDADREGLTVLQPPGWPRPRGYANGIAGRGTSVFIAGMIGWNSEGRFESADFIAQTRQALENIVLTLAEAGGKPEHLVRLTWFVVSKREYLEALPRLGPAYRAALGTHYPAMSVVEVSALIEDEARVEIEATALIPD